jgi:hypothetical protein
VFVTYVFAPSTLQRREGSGGKSIGEVRCVATWRVGAGLGWASWGLEVREVGVSILHCTVYKPAIQRNRSDSAKGTRLRSDV